MFSYYGYIELFLKFITTMVIIYLLYRYLLFNNKIDKIDILKKKEKEEDFTEDQIDKDWRL